MAATWSQVTGFAPELAATAVATQTAYLDAAARLTNHAAFKTDADVAEALMAAHLLTLQARAAMGGAGPITSNSVGPVSVSFGTPAEAEKSLSQTGYGQMLRMFQRKLMQTPFLTSGC